MENALTEVLAPYVPPALLDQAVAAVVASESSRAYALPQAANPTTIADDGTVAFLPPEWLDAAQRSLDNRWDRGWTGGTISTVAVVAHAFEAASRGEQPLMWEDRD